MSILHAIVLGIVQGLTEFLPISSSGHLEIVPWLFGWNDYDTVATAKAFDTALHLGTLVAVLIYLRGELTTYVRQGAQVIFNRRQPASIVGRQAWFLVASAIPAGVVGIIFEDAITERLGTPNLIAISLIAFGLLLVWADRRASAMQNLARHRPTQTARRSNNWCGPSFGAKPRYVALGHHDYGGTPKRLFTRRSCQIVFFDERANNWWRCNF